MARKARVQFEGACYHVINRGNFCQDIFTGPGAAGSFEKALYEAIEKKQSIRRQVLILYKLEARKQCQSMNIALACKYERAKENASGLAVQGRRNYWSLKVFKPGVRMDFD